MRLAMISACALLVPVVISATEPSSTNEPSASDLISFLGSKEASHSWKAACTQARAFLVKGLGENPNADVRYSAMPSDTVPNEPGWIFRVAHAAFPLFRDGHYTVEHVINERDRSAYVIHRGQQFSLGILVTPSLDAGTQADPLAKYYPSKFGQFDQELDAFNYSLLDVRCSSPKREIREILDVFLKRRIVRKNPDYRVYLADFGRQTRVETYRSDKNGHYYYQATFDNGHSNVSLRYDFDSLALYEKAAPYLWTQARAKFIPADPSPGWLTKLEKDLSTDVSEMGSSGRMPASKSSAKARKKNH